MISLRASTALAVLLCFLLTQTHQANVVGDLIEGNRHTTSSYDLYSDLFVGHEYEDAINEEVDEPVNFRGDNKYVLVSADYSEGVYSIVARYTGTEPFYKKKTSPIVKVLNITITILSEEELSIKIKDATDTRWEVPETYPFANDKDLEPWTRKLQNYAIEYDKKPFALRVTRKRTNEIIFDTTNSDFIFSDKYIEFTTTVPTSHIFGLGERAYQFQYEEGNFTIFNADHPITMENGTVGNQLYGTHPVWLFKEGSGAFDAILLRTTNGLDFIIGKDNFDKRTITFKVIGGIIDLRFFLGDRSPETAMKLYHRYLGGWLMPPFWALGFHQCRWGYRNLDDLKGVYNNYTSNGLPLDTVWTDIDYMVDYQDFTIDEERYPLDKLKKFFRKSGLHFIPIIDAGIAVGDNLAFSEGIRRNLFLKSGEHPGEPLWGVVWPGRVHYVDFLHPNATGYWEDMLATLYQQVEFDGLWLDMNEASNFCDGECPPPTFGEDDDEGSPYSPDLPYDIGGAPFDKKTLSHSAIHFGGYEEFNLHNTFGYLQTIATHDYLKNRLNFKLPFIVSRSSFWGQGKYGTHWTGDNLSDCPWLRVSIPHLFSFGLFGMPMIGADICGFAGNAKPELCARWMQLGTLYPFARNHNINDSISQEPYALGKLVMETSRNALKFRYSLLKYYYMLFIRLRGEGSVFKPVFFEFPEDKHVYEHKIMNEQLLVGPDLLFTPVLHQGVDTFTPYFPEGAWYDVLSGKEIQSAQENPARRKVTNKLPDVVPGFLRGGRIVYLQETSNVLKVKDLNEEFTFIAAVSKTREGTLEAAGKIASLKDYTNDDVIVKRCIQKNCMINVNVTNDAKKPEVFYIYFTPEDPTFKELSGFIIKKIKFFGAGKEVSQYLNAGIPTATVENVDGTVSDHLVLKRKVDNNGVLHIDFDGIEIEKECKITITL